jgi:hypothetical protein
VKLTPRYAVLAGSNVNRFTLPKNISECEVPHARGRGARVICRQMPTAPLGATRENHHVADLYDGFDSGDLHGPWRADRCGHGDRGRAGRWHRRRESRRHHPGRPEGGASWPRDMGCRLRWISRHRQRPPRERPLRGPLMRT